MIISKYYYSLLFHLFILPVHVLAQNIIPESINECQNQLDIIRCDCLYSILTSSQNLSEIAYSHYYIGIDPCDSLNISNSKYHLNKARELWDSIEYNSFRYLYTYLYLVEHYHKNSNIDSVDHFYKLLISVPRDNHPNSLNNILEATLKRAWTYLTKGDIFYSNLILSNFQQSKTYLNFTNIDKAWFLNSLGESYTDVGTDSLLNEALNLHKESRRLANQSNTPQDEITFLSFINNFGEARANRLLGNYQSSQNQYLNFFQYSLETNNIMFQAISAAELGILFYEQDNYTKAITWLLRSIEKFEDIDNSFLYSAEPYQIIAELYFQEGRINESIQFALDGLSISSKDSFDITSPANQYRNPVLAIKLLIVLARNYRTQQNLDLAEENLEFAFEYLHNLTNNHLDLRSKYDLKKTQANLFEEIIQLEKEKGNIEILFNKADRIKHSILISEVRRNSKGRKSYLSESISETIVQYFSISDSIFAILRKDKDYLLYNLASEKQFHHLFKNKFIKGKKNSFFYQLYKLLIAPLPLNSGERITIIPDGPLAYVPFGALLQDSLDSKSSLDSYFNISYQLSLNLLNELVERKYNNSGATAFMPKESLNPVKLSKNYNTTFSPLPFAANELLAVVSELNAQELELSENNFLNAMAGSKILHFIGHATSSRKSKPFLVFDNNIIEDSARFTLDEIYNSICNNDMVVLSGCETGIGEVVDKEGVISLARGFLYAGAKSVISTLWSINDQSSAFIMTEFYKELKKGKRKDEALRQAKLTYLDQAAPEYQHPYYWAAFIAIGDMSPLFFPYRKYKIGGAVLVGILVLGFGAKKAISFRSAA